MSKRNYSMCSFVTTFTWSSENNNKITTRIQKSIRKRLLQRKKPDGTLEHASSKEDDQDHCIHWLIILFEFSQDKV